MAKKHPGAERIEQALLRLLKAMPLQDISVTDLCRAAHASRSTFYAHYSNTEDVYRSLIRQLVFGTRSLKTQLKQAEGSLPTTKQPLCALMQEEEYQGLVSDDRFMRVFIELCREESTISAHGIYDEICEDEAAAHALFVFQLSGCIATAKALAQGPDWEQAKDAIDAFIRGGLRGVRQRRS